MLLANKNFPLIGPSRTALIGTLAALVFAAHCAAAPGTIAVTGITTSSSAPGGFIYDGTRMWMTDAVKGLCQINGGNLSNCILPPTTLLGVHAVLGQPAFDVATGNVYVPDMSAGSKGIWRYHFNQSNFGTSLSGVNIAATAGLGSQRPGAVTIGDDGNLYVSMTANNSFVRVNLPATAAQTVDVMGKTLSGAPARGLAYVGPQLWIADTDGESIIPAASACATKCRPTVNVQVGVPNPLSIAFDQVNSLVYMGTSFGVFQYNLLTGQNTLYSKHWQNGLVSGLFSNVNALGVDTAGNLYFIDDPTASQVVGGATAYSVPANSLPDGLGNLGSPAPTVPPFLSPAPAFANYAQLYSTGMTAPTGAIYMGTHAWVTDGTLGFCKVVPTLPAPSLTACAALPVGFVAGSPGYDKVSKQAYLADTSGANGIVKVLFNSTTETVGVATTVVPNTVLVAAAAGATAPTALAVGPDGQLYAAMLGTNQILRVATPAAATHKVTFIGNIFDQGAVSIAFHNSDLWAAEKASASIIYGATLCQGNCTSLFFPQAMQLPPLAVTADATHVYVGDGQKVMMFDPIANVYSTMADTGLVAGVPTVFNNISGLALDGQGNLFAADAGPLWLIGAGGVPPTITSLSPVQAPEGSTPTVTITGTNFLGTSLVVSTCVSGAITPGNVTVVSATQISATFAINPVGPLGACNITVTTPNGASAASAGSSFTVLIGPPALTSITPNSGFRGHAAVPVSIAGANMGSGSINAIPGITISNTVVNATGTLTTANFLISGTAALGAQNVIMSTPSGPSNAVTFTINAAPPVLATIAPLTGVANSTVAVTLTGTDLFGATVNPPAGFTLSGVPVVTATSISATYLIASTVVAGPQSFTVTTAGGTSNGMTIKILPALTSMLPSSARAGAATVVTLTGTSLAGVTSVTGANITATGVVATATTVTATFTSLASAPVGPVSVTVTDANGTSNAITFTLIGPVPTITSISPATGGTGATVAITITGTGLTFGSLNLPAGITVVGTPVSTFSSLTANILIAGNATLGVQNISVTTPGAGNTSNTSPFTVFALSPLLNANGIAPTTAAAGTTVPVILTGRGFTGTTSVNTGLGLGITVSSFTINSDTQITATFAIALSATTQQISVTNPNGTSNSLTFGIVPTLSSINPTSKPASLSVLVTLTGTSLTGATAINAGANITVTNLTVVSSTQITATFAIAAAAVTGNRNITVTTPGGTTNAVVFNVLPPPPTITQLNAPFKRGSNQGVTLDGGSLAGATAFTAIQVFQNGTALPTGTWAVTGFQTSATQLRWNWTIPNTLAASGAGVVYTMTVTTPSGTTAPFVFAVQ